MSLIEKAAKRLEELKRAGVTLPEPQVEPHVGRAVTDDAAFPPNIDSPAVLSGAGDAISAKADGGSNDSKARRTTSAVAQLDIGRLAVTGVVTPDKPRSPIAEEFRVVKRPLIANAMGKSAAPIHHGNLIMVTSALPGEGKTFTAANLAMSIAMELDHTVLLVDADVAKPTMMKLLDMTPSRGLLDVLVDSSLDLGDVLQRTNVEKLTILQSGSSHSRATELLASDAMNRLLEEVANRYADRIVIFDSPPLLATTESRVLATHMGQIVFVVAAEQTTHAAVKQALATIENCPVKLMMLNKSRLAGAGSYYGYHGYKSYASYGYGS